MKTDFIKNIIRSKWVISLSTLIILGSSFYLYLFISTGWNVGYIGVEKNFRYWLLFPYDDTYTIALLSAFLFIICGFVVIFGLAKPNHTLHKNLLVSAWAILAFIGTVFFCGFMLLLSIVGGVARLDSISYDNLRYHLAYKNNFEYGFKYYLVECNTQTYQCEFVDSFFPQGLILSDDEALLSRLELANSDKLTVVYKNQVIYEHSLLK